ncbi:AMP-binding protein [Nocardiopsis xinjiangensis]|uniref:AMP-binding protein n=1 Tax=Nocardiopsis xinjiangensis TaxID=124285 RepID=UPI0003470855|nr:AMP-binding protein [Nocardiopsis xinjiangensis]
MSSATDALRAARDQLLDLRTDHAAALERFTWPDVGSRFNWAHDWFDPMARGNDRPALVIVEPDGSRTCHTFDEMARRSDRLAVWLSRQGVRRGDALLAMLGNQVELWDTMLAAIKLGAVLVPTTSAVDHAGLVDRIERSGARHVVCDAGDTAKFADAGTDLTRVAVGGAPGWLDPTDAQELGEVRPDHPGNASTDRLLLYFTSGTTNRPKLVEHTHISYPVGHLSTLYWLGLRPGDVHLNVSSPGWAKHAWSNFFAPWLAEATVFLYNYERFDAQALLRRMASEEVTTFCAPPTVWRMLLNADLSGGPGALREAIGAGEPLNPEVIAQIEHHWGLTIRDGYGQTEMTATVANTPGQTVRPGSMGRPLPGVPVVLVDPATGGPVEPGTEGAEGEICLDLSQAPLTLMRGYQGDPERDAEAKEGGYYHTGDVATIDTDGQITYVGRTDDVFKSSDYKVSPFEVESVLIEHPAVAEAAVVPAPDPVRLSVPKAYLLLAPGHEPTRETARAVFAHARQNLAPWQRVRRLEFAALPKTVSGKIRRVELRSREQEGADTEGEWREEEFPDLRTGGA